MGLFDIFKKKEEEAQPASEQPTAQQPAVAQTVSQLFLPLGRYKEYIALYVQLQHQNNYAPVAAYLTSSGELMGQIYVLEEDNTYGLSAPEVYKLMLQSLSAKLRAEEIKSFIILFHANAVDGGFEMAQTQEEFKAIALTYGLPEDKSGTIGMLYEFGEKQINYGGFNAFTKQENDILFNVQLKEDFDYFTDRQVTPTHMHENSAGIKVYKSNSLDITNTWQGLCGFEYITTEEGNKAVGEYLNNSLSTPAVLEVDGFKVHSAVSGNFSTHALVKDNQIYAAYPELQTDYILLVEIKQIHQWENVFDLLATVKGNGRSTFGFSFFALDYASNKAKYLSTPMLNMHISGIAMVMDLYEVDATSEVKMSEDFTAYMPNKDVLNNSMHDIVGQVVAMEPVHALGNEKLNGYIIKTRLITTEEDANFFTIDIFVNKQNMRCAALHVGMKVTGVVQFQGRIAD
jgi:hypothetical protein